MIVSVFYNSGIGKAAAIGIAKTGATVVIGCRDLKKGLKAIEDIKGASGYSHVDMLLIDLASQKQYIGCQKIHKQICTASRNL